MPNPTKKTQKKIELIEKLALQGKSIAEISRELKIDYHALYPIVRKYNLQVRDGRDTDYVKRCCNKRSKLGALTKEILHSLYWIEGKSLYDLAVMYEVLPSALYYRFKQHGIPTRTRGEASRINSRKPEVREKHRNNARNGLTGFHARKNSGKTWIEKLFEEWSIAKNIQVQYGFQIKPNGHRYDFLITNSRVIIELDGRFWHDTPHQREMDRQFEDEAREAGYIVFRIGDDILKRIGEQAFDELFSSKELRKSIRRRY